MTMHEIYLANYHLLLVHSDNLINFLHHLAICVALISKRDANRQTNCRFEKKIKRDFFAPKSPPDCWITDLSVFSRCPFEPFLLVRVMFVPRGHAKD